LALGFAVGWRVLWQGISGVTISVVWLFFFLVAGVALMVDNLAIICSCGHKLVIFYRKFGCDNACHVEISLPFFLSKSIEDHVKILVAIWLEYETLFRILSEPVCEYMIFVGIWHRMAHL